MLQTAKPRLLVVEDEFLIRLTLVEALTDEEFDVLEAESGDAALPLLCQDPSIALLVTDIQLPGSLDGRGLVEQAHKVRPSLTVLFMTGRPDSQAAAAAPPHVSYIAKPYTLTEMVAAVRRLVTGPT